MGNVPISCCRSKSPRLESLSGRNNSGNYRNGTEGQYSNTNHDQSSRSRYSNKKRQQGSGDNFDTSSQPSHILQHISEREPDDSENDPSSNPFNRPIFATRSSATKNKSNYTDSYSSNNSISRRRNTTPLTSSQDHGYNSNTSTNLTHYDGQLNDSFDSSIQRSRQQSVTKEPNDLILNDTIENSSENKLLLLNSPTNSEGVEQLTQHINRFDMSFDRRFHDDQLLKSSSCSTIFIDDSTISHPNLKQTLQCVSLAIYYQIKNRISDSHKEIFDETVYPLKMPTQNETDSDARNELIILEEEPSNKVTEEPDQKTIYSFVKTLFKAAQLTSEYAITALVYLERLMSYAEVDLTPKTWRRMFLGAILLSSKVWEDQAVWNVDYAQILEEISVEDINELERHFLELIEFNINVPSSVYAKYYFHLRTLATKNGFSEEQSLLTVDKAKTLEAMSRVNMTDWQLSPIHRKQSPVMKRHASLEKLRFNGRARAILM